MMMSGFCDLKSLKTQNERKMILILMTEAKNFYPVRFSSSRRRRRGVNIDFHKGKAWWMRRWWSSRNRHEDNIFIINQGQVDNMYVLGLTSIKEGKFEQFITQHIGIDQPWCS